jgi:hypothetical protein
MTIGALLIVCWSSGALRTAPTLALRHRTRTGYHTQPLTAIAAASFSACEKLVAGPVSG